MKITLRPEEIKKALIEYINGEIDTSLDEERSEVDYNFITPQGKVITLESETKIELEVYCS